MGAGYFASGVVFAALRHLCLLVWFLCLDSQTTQKSLPRTFTSTVANEEQTKRILGHTVKKMQINYFADSIVRICFGKNSSQFNSIDLT